MCVRVGGWMCDCVSVDGCVMRASERGQCSGACMESIYTAPPPNAPRYMRECGARSVLAYTGCLRRKAFVGWMQVAVAQLVMRNKCANALAW